MVHPVTAALATMLLAANASPPPADSPLSDPTPGTAPSTAIVGGHHIQPKANAGQNGGDISKRDAEDVDRLYQELMRETAPDAARGKALPSPQ